MITLQHGNKDQLDSYLTNNLTQQHIYRFATQLLDIQDNLNIISNGEDYKTTLVNETTGRHINFHLAYQAELIELLESIDWKHWKVTNKQPDLNNILIELVDIMHFVLSMLLTKFNNSVNYPIDDIKTFIYTELVHNMNLIHKKEYHFNELIKSYIDAVENKHSIDYVNKMFINIIQFRLMDGIMISQHPTYEEIEHVCHGIIHGFLLLVASVFGYFYYVTAQSDRDNIQVPTFDDIIKLYILKNVLNKFRQDHGYKEGTYVKEWFGKEDNEYLFQIRDELDDSIFESTDSIYNKLKDIYHDVIHGN